MSNNDVVLPKNFAIKAGLSIDYTAKSFATIYHNQSDKAVEETLGFPEVMVMFTSQQSLVQFCPGCEYDKEILIMLLREYARQLEEDKE